MSGTGDLFDDIIPDSVMPPHVRSSETSREAAVHLEPRFGGKMREVLAFIRARGDKGATCKEVEIGLGFIHETTSSAKRELEKRGLVHATPRKRRNPGTGRNAEIIVVGPDPNKDMVPGSPKKRQAKFRKGQKIRYRFQAPGCDVESPPTPEEPAGVSGTLCTGIITGQGKVTNKIALEGSMVYLIDGRWACHENEMAKVGEIAAWEQGEGQTP